MSLKSWLHDIFASLKAKFENLEPKAKEAVAIGVRITDKIKEAYDKGYVDIATSLIPGSIDDTIAALIKEALPKIMIELQLAAKCMEADTPDAIVACAIDTLKSLGGSTAQYDFYDSLATQIALVAADGKFTWDDIKSTIKWYNDHVKQTLPQPAGTKQ